jgi:hypothetical protein
MGCCLCDPKLSRSALPTLFPSCCACDSALLRLTLNLVPSTLLASLLTVGFVAIAASVAVGH